MNNIRRLCMIMQISLQLFLIVQVLFFLLCWIQPAPLNAPGNLMQLLPDGMTAAEMQSLTPTQRLLGAAIGMLPLGVMIYGLVRLRQTLNSFRTGAIFAVTTIGRMRSFAGALFFSVGLSLLEKPLRVIMLNETLHRSNYKIVFDINSYQFLLLLVCGMFYLIAAIMHEGRRLGEENESFI
ncbi:MAG: hypothetical protein ABW202_11705 [Duganella sp.]